MNNQTQIMWKAQRYLPLMEQLHKKVKDEGCTGIRVDIGADGTAAISFYNPMIVGYEEQFAHYDFRSKEFYDVGSQTIQAAAG